MTVKILTYLDSVSSTLLQISTGSESADETFSETDFSNPPTQYVNTVSDLEFEFDEADITMNYIYEGSGDYVGGVAFTWDIDAPGWSSGDELAVTIESRGSATAETPTPTPSPTPTPAANNPASGAPTISVTAQVGQTLTADTSGISDADGLTNVSYSYQWLSSRDTEIDGATGSTYSPTTSDVGKVIKVRVTFTDDAGNEESLTSEGTSAVVVGGL